MLAYASVPLYRLFCQVTGFGGTTGQATTPSEIITNHEINVHFNTDLAPELNWSFKPVQPNKTLKAGEQTLVFFEAVNHTDQEMFGTSLSTSLHIRQESILSKQNASVTKPGGWGQMNV